MVTRLDADSLIEAGILESSGAPVGAERFCTDLVVRVLSHHVASGAVIVRVSEKATWHEVGGYGRLLDVSSELDGDTSADHPDYLAALREGHLVVPGAAPSGGTLHAIGISDPFLGLLLIDMTETAELAASATKLLSHAASLSLTDSPSASSSPARRGEAVDAGFFSPRQLEVLELVAAGKSNTEIGRKLSISASLAKLEVSFLMHALGAKNRLEAVVEAQRSGLLPVTPHPGVAPD